MKSYSQLLSFELLYGWQHDLTVTQIQLTQTIQHPFWEHECCGCIIISKPYFRISYVCMKHPSFIPILLGKVMQWELLSATVADFPLQKFWGTSNINTLLLLYHIVWPFIFTGSLCSCFIYPSPFTINNRAISTHEMFGLTLPRSQKELHQYHWCKELPEFISSNSFPSHISRSSSTSAKSYTSLPLSAKRG